MDQAKIKSGAWTLARSALALLLVVAGALKAAQPSGFISDLENYRLLTPAFAFGLGLYLPWLEIATAAALVWRPARLAGWLSATFLGLGFTVFVASAWARGLDVSCGCFGGVGSPVGPASVARATGIFVFSLAGFVGEFRRSQTQRTGGK